jgi:hypothetical protein
VLNKKGYLSTGFGGWIILSKPYKIYGKRKVPFPKKVEYKSRILEIMFGIRNEQYGEKIKAGGDDWHRVIWRCGLRFDINTAWFIFQYILDQAKIGKRTIHHLNSETFSKLIKSLEDNQPFEEKNVIGKISHNLHEMVYCTDPILTDLDLNNAKFRIAYIYLEGMTDLGATAASRAKVEHYKIYHFHKKI